MFTPAAAVEWFFPVRTRFGVGTRFELANILKTKSCCKPLICTDVNLAKSPLVAELMQCLREANINPTLYGKIPPNPTDTSIMEGVEVFHSIEADSLVAFGGGSGLDGGKSIALVAGSGASLLELNWQLTNPVPGKFCPVITIPTTAGTGSEMDIAAMYTVTADGEKACVAHPECVVEAILDPELTLSLPSHLTAYTGMDALTHAIEALCVDMYHPMCDGISLEAIRIIYEFLPKAYYHGDDIEARSQMLTGSAMAAVAFQKGLGAVHGLSEPIGAVFDTQHGLANAVILPYVMMANRDIIGHKCELIASYLNLPGSESGFEKVMKLVIDMRTLLKIPNTLNDLGIPLDASKEIAEKAERNSTGFTNPKRLNKYEYESIFIQAHSGLLSL